MQDGVHRSKGYASTGSYLPHTQAAVFHNHLFHSRNHVLRSAVRFVWVKGHAANPENERCDILATTAADGTHLAEDTGYRPEK